MNGKTQKLSLAGCAVLVLVLVQPGPVRGEDDRAILARLNQELAAMEPLIAAAERAPRAPGSRLTFHYGALRNDLEKIRQGIREYIQLDTTLPRTKPILPLEGDYAH